MNKKAFFAAALCALPLLAGAQEPAERLDSVVVSVSRAGEKTPVTFTSLSEADLASEEMSKSLPMALNLQPSVVTYNEGGTGLGNSAMTIRGVKGSQINVTLNGVTLNDAESQEVFWVNIPALSSILSSVQVQRGLGTSANGPGAFGASINMSTPSARDTLAFRASLSAGSYGTLMSTVSASTGKLPSGFYMDLSYAVGSTDGYIRNAFVKSASLYAVAGWQGRRNSLRLSYLMGGQKSGITWDGISLEQYEADRRYNGAGEYTDDSGNIRYYDNQTDNYRQHHIQLNYTHSFDGSLYWTTTLDYTRGDGYDEYYKTNRKLPSFGFPQNSGRSDMIYRKQMDNDLYALNSNLRYLGRRLSLNAGVSASRYLGGHWGEVLWAKTIGKDYDYQALDWYSNFGAKWDLSAYARAEFSINSVLTAYADAQLRIVDYAIDGADDDWLSYGAQPSDLLSYKSVWPFFNPRAGITANLGAHRLYLSAAFGNKEPGRGDIKENYKGEANPLVPEKMLDIEAGYAWKADKASAGVNLYLMEYWDILLESGKLSNAGYAIKENVPRGWRRGIELMAAWEPFKWLGLDANATLSVNRLAEYTSYVPLDDDSGRTHAISYGQSTMLLSPSLIGMARAQLRPWKGSVLSLDAKYVGKQYIDNSGREEMAIPAFFVMNLSAAHTFRLKGSMSLELAAYVNNLLNRMYYAYGWRWESYNESSGDLSYGIGVYPQAPRNFSIKASLYF